jgi:hypothetical protein
VVPADPCAGRVVLGDGGARPIVHSMFLTDGFLVFTGGSVEFAFASSVVARPAGSSGSGSSCTSLILEPLHRLAVCYVGGRVALDRTHLLEGATMAIGYNFVVVRIGGGDMEAAPAAPDDRCEGSRDGQRPHAPPTGKRQLR